MHASILLIQRFRIFLSFFLFGIQVIFPMEFSPKLSTSNGSDDLTNKPIYTHKLYNFSKKTKDVSSLAMIISPVKNDNSVLIGKKGGIVSRFVLEKSQQEEILLQHHSVNHIPIFVAAEKKGSLFIVSAGNYNDDESNIKRSECCIWHEGSLKTKVLKPLQAIAVDKQANLLVTADQVQRLSLIDLNTDKEIGTHLFYSVNKVDRIIDIKFRPDGKQIAVARTLGITLMDCDGDGLKNLQYIKNINDIKSIYFPTAEKLFYITRDKKVRRLNILDALNKPESEDIKPITVFDKLLHDQIIVNEEGDVAVLWTKNKNALDFLRHEIAVRKRCSNKIEEFELEVPTFDEKHEYTSKKGYLKYSKNHLCRVALSRNIVAAIGTDGMLHWWKIADDISKGEYKTPDIIETLEDQPKRKKSSPRPLSALILSDSNSRKRSTSENDTKKLSGLMSRSTLSDGNLESTTGQSRKGSPRNGAEEKKEEKPSQKADFVGRAHKSNGV